MRQHEISSASMIHIGRGTSLRIGENLKEVFNIDRGMRSCFLNYLRTTTSTSTRKVSSYTHSTKNFLNRYVTYRGLS